MLSLNELRVPRKNRYTFILFYGYFLLVILITATLPADLRAYSFPLVREQNERQVFKHWNTSKREITGYSHVRFFTENTQQKAYLVENNQNSHANGVVFSEKFTWFDPQSGEVVKYAEKDFRTDIQIVNTYTREGIKTEVTEEGVIRHLTVDGNPELVPFEIIAYYLQSKMDVFTRGKSISFKLYIPLIALELEKKGLPTSLSKVGMKATPENIVVQHTILGRIRTIKITVQPSSFLVNAILPDDKSRFDFVFQVDRPCQLLQLEEAETKMVLMDAD